MSAHTATEKREAEKKKEGPKLYEVKSKMLSRWRKSFRGKAATMKKIFGCAVVSASKARRWEAYSTGSRENYKEHNK